MSQVPGGSLTELEPAAFRRALGHYASGITIVTSSAGDEPIGMTCQSFYSVSLEPPLVSICVAHTSTTYPRIRATGRFCVNVLARRQHGVSTQFARSGTDKWAGIRWSPSGLGNPVLDGVVMWVDCTLVAEYRAGDHDIVVGQVSSVSPVETHADEPLIFFQGRYRELAS